MTRSSWLLPILFALLWLPGCSEPAGPGGSFGGGFNDDDDDDSTEPVTDESVVIQVEPDLLDFGSVLIGEEQELSATIS